MEKKYQSRILLFQKTIQHSISLYKHLSVFRNKNSTDKELCNSIYEIETANIPIYRKMFCDALISAGMKLLNKSYDNYIYAAIRKICCIISAEKLYLLLPFINTNDITIQQCCFQGIVSTIGTGRIREPHRVHPLIRDIIIEFSKKDFDKTDAKQYALHTNVYCAAVLLGMHNVPLPRYLFSSDIKILEQAGIYHESDGLFVSRRIYK